MKLTKREFDGFVYPLVMLGNAGKSLAELTIAVQVAKKLKDDEATEAVGEMSGVTMRELRTDEHEFEFTAEESSLVVARVQDGLPLVKMASVEEYKALLDKLS